MIELGICANVDKAEAVAKTGAAFVEENVQSFLVPESPDAEFAPKLEAAKRSALPVAVANCFLPASIKCVGPEVDFGRIERWAEAAFRRAEEAGVGIIVFGSGGARKVPDGFSSDEAADQFVDVLRRIAPAAANHNVLIVVEPLNTGECNFITTLAEGADIVSRCGHESVRLLADIYHMLRDKEPASEIARHGALIRHVHIAEVEKRTAPGVAGDDFGPYLAALRETGYSGRIALECGWEDLAGQAPGALHALRAQMERAGL